MWTYGLQLWVITKMSIQFKLIKVLALRKPTNFPPYVANLTLYRYLKIKTAHKKELAFYIRFRSKLLAHSNHLISNLACRATILVDPKR